MQPTIVYKKGGKHRGPKGVSFSYKGVSDEESLKALLADGWSLTMEEAMTSKKALEKENDALRKEIQKVEAKQYKDLTEEDKEKIKERLEAGEKPGDIAKDYEIHHLSIVRVKRELD